MVTVLGGIAGRVCVVGCGEFVEVKGCCEFVLFSKVVPSQATGMAVVVVPCEVGMAAAKLGLRCEGGRSSLRCAHNL